MEEELRNMIDSKWQWNVRQVSESEYLTNFPNKQILDALSKSNGVNFALYNITALVAHSSMDPMASSMLQTGWVMMHNIPAHARTVEASTLIAELVGDVVAIDEVTLIREGPVRAKISSRNISNIRGILEIFINGVGYDIKFVPELQKKKSQDPPPPPPPKKPDNDFQDEEDEDSYDSEYDHKRGRKSNRGRGEEPEGSRNKGQNSGGGKQCSEKGDVVMEDRSDPRSNERKEGYQEAREIQPISMYNPKTKDLMIFRQDEKMEEQMKEQEQGDQDQGEEITVDKTKQSSTPTNQPNYRKTPNNKKTDDCTSNLELWSQESVGCEEEDLMRVEDSEEQGGDNAGKEIEQVTEEEFEMQRGQKAVAKQDGATKRYYQVVAARKSSRGRIQEERSQPPFNNSLGTTPCFTNSFTILDSCKDSLLEEIAQSCDIALGGNE
ncbi:unnamed protein product [Urochloa humidicola]